MGVTVTEFDNGLLILIISGGHKFWTTAKPGWQLATRSPYKERQALKQHFSAWEFKVNAQPLMSLPSDHLNYELNHITCADKCIPKSKDKNLSFSQNGID